MGTPKGEGRSRGARSKGGDRRPETSSHAARTAQSGNGGRGGRAGGASGVVEQEAVIDAHGTTLEPSLDTEHKSAESAAGESQVLVSKPIEIVNKPATDAVAPQTVLGGDELPTGGSANSNHRADIVQVPPSAQRETEPAAAPGARSARRDHAARLEAASVLDAPASLHESVSPPSGGSWALRVWVAAMLGIIGMAGVVALRDGGRASEGESTAPPLSTPVASVGAPAAVVPVPAVPTVAQVPETKPVPVTAVAPAQALSEPVKAAPVAKEAATTSAAAAVAEKAASAESAVDPALAEDTLEARGRARRAARRAATGLSVGALGEAPKAPAAALEAVPEPAKSKSVEAPPAPAQNTAVSIPGNPYEGDDSMATGAP